MGPSREAWNPPGRNSYSNYRPGTRDHKTFATPPLAARPALFCCPVAESNPAHLPRSFVNPGRHQMNLQLRSFLNCADDARLTLERCEVSHMIEVTTRVLHTSNPASQDRSVVEQWNIPVQPHNTSVNFFTPPLEADSNMSVDDHDAADAEPPRTTYQSMSTRHFITQPSTNEWQMPPDSKAFRERNPQSKSIRTEHERLERYIEIPPFCNWPYTSDGIGGGSGPSGTRPWTPSCSIVMWCNEHNYFYEVHTVS